MKLKRIIFIAYLLITNFVFGQDRAVLKHYMTSDRSDNDEFGGALSISGDFMIVASEHATVSKEGIEISRGFLCKRCLVRNLFRNECRSE